jgi:LPXTG-motif cell wall-anchored protein
MDMKTIGFAGAALIAFAFYLIRRRSRINRD